MPERQRRAHQHEVDVGEGADEGEQDAEADAEGGAQRRIAPVRDRGSERRRHRAHRVHRLDPRDGEVDQHRAGQIEQREEIEIRGEPEAYRRRPPRSAGRSDCSRHCR